jgi:hypothetical protein
VQRYDYGAQELRTTGGPVVDHAHHDTAQPTVKPAETPDDAAFLSSLAAAFRQDQDAVTRQELALRLDRFLEVVQPELPSYEPALRAALVELIDVAGQVLRDPELSRASPRYAALHARFHRVDAGT